MRDSKGEARKYEADLWPVFSDGGVVEPLCRLNCLCSPGFLGEPRGLADVPLRVTAWICGGWGQPLPLVLCKC
jgi:hypothetical protein